MPILRTPLRPRRRSSRGVAMVEFVLITPILLTMVFGVVDYARFSQYQIMLTSSAEAGSRWAQLSPTAWSSAASPATNSIQYQVVVDSGAAAIPNDDAHITIAYWQPNGGSPTKCGHYSQASGGFVDDSGGTVPAATCYGQGNLVAVTVKGTYSLTTPLAGRYAAPTVAQTDWATIQ